MSLHEVQVYLDREGASDLVAELVMKSSLSPNVFMEAITPGKRYRRCRGTFGLLQ
jgi:hypothetical protein